MTAVCAVFSRQASSDEKSCDAFTMSKPETDDAEEVSHVHQRRRQPPQLDMLVETLQKDLVNPMVARVGTM